MVARSKPPGSKALELMKELVMLTGEKWVSASRFTGMADRWGIDDPTVRVTFIAGVREILRTIPVQVFADADVRQSILNAAQEALDAAIDEEEAMKE